MTVLTVSALALVATALAGLRAQRLARRRYAAAELLHELRGALTAIELGVSTLERTAGRWDTSARIDAFQMQVERAHSATRDLAALLACGTGASDREVDALIEVGEVVRRHAAAWGRLAVPRGGRVEFYWEPGRAIVRARAERLCRALDNLIANALEHGGGLVRVEGALDGAVVRVVVSDQGPGLGGPIEHLRRASWDAPRGHGLAIARRAVELDGGRLRSIPRPGGTAIQIELPLHAAFDRSGEGGMPPLASHIPAEARAS